MTVVSEILGTFPGEIHLDKKLLTHCIYECIICAQSCTACADADLSEKTVEEMRKCIRDCLDCADVCETTARILTRQTAYDANMARLILQACIYSCKSCGDECERHAPHHEHCRICMETCRRCEKACRELLAAAG
jgi:hypothetical protein